VSCSPPPAPVIPWGLVAIVALALIFAGLDWLTRPAGKPPHNT
jgi:hypothetical protein